MPFQVNGWVEVTWISPEERGEFDSLWMPLLSLAPFNIVGDDLSAHLFGLSKTSEGPGLFGDRGVPIDCCRTVRTEVEQNPALINKHGEGDFGHSHASLEEIRECLVRDTVLCAPKSEWHHLLASVDFALRDRNSSLYWCRIIVWANW